MLIESFMRVDIFSGHSTTDMVLLLCSTSVIPAPMSSVALCAR